MFRLLVSDASGENEGYLLAETVPNWAVDVTVKVLTECTLRSKIVETNQRQFSLLCYELTVVGKRFLRLLVAFCSLSQVLVNVLASYMRALKKRVKKIFEM